MSEVRLIDAVGVMDDIEKYCGDYSCHDDNSFDKNAVRIAIKGAPTITPESLGWRKETTGEWKGYTTSAYVGLDEYREPKWANRKFYRCSICRTGTAIKSKFCPVCGARMDGEP